MTEPLACCELCPRECGVNRLGGERGYCGAGTQAEVFRYGPHHGEEPPVSGSRGSGTVFFRRCTMRCVYCQNYRWSRYGDERDARDVAGLADILVELADAGCHNWNLVSPTPWLPMLDEALTVARKRGVTRPTVYNTSGYERIETLRRYRQAADVYLTDLRYASEGTAAVGSDAHDYVRCAREALLEMWRLAGPLVLDMDGLAVRGVICRLLVLPGRADEAVTTLRWLACELGTEVTISLMAQYYPVYRAAGMGEPWNRRLRRDEYEAVRLELERLGFESGWVQEWHGEAETSLLGTEMQAGSGLPA